MRSARLDRLAGACQPAGFKAEQSIGIRVALWTKFAFICALAGPTAAVRLPIGEIRAGPASRELSRKVAAEVCEVASAEGISLPAGLPDRHRAFAGTVEAGSYSSLYHDLGHSGATELESLLGEVTRRVPASASASP